MSVFRRSVRMAETSRARVQPIDLLFDHQRAVLQDPSKFKALLCGRRAGKTDLIIKDLAQGMLDDVGSRNLFVALTLDSAREILWEPFKALNTRHSWGFNFDNNLHIVTHANGSRLLVRGAEDVRQLEKPRGQKFRRIRIDECGAHRPSYLRYFVEEVLEPTLMDDPAADVWLAGTCTTQVFGFFFELTTGVRPGYSVHSWTAKHNPFVDWEGFVYGRDGKPGLFERRGWTEEHAIFRREYLAEWASESTDLVFRFDRSRNMVKELPALRAGDRWVRVMAADFGIGDATAVGILAYPEKYGQDVYLEHSWGVRGEAPSDTVARIAKTCADYRPSMFVGDVNGLGKSYDLEWNKRHSRDAGLPMIPARKADKRAALEIVSDAFHTSRGGEVGQRRGFFVLEGNDTAARQFATLLWNEERSDIADGQDDDFAMMGVYGFRATPAFANAFDAPLPPETPKIANTAFQGMLPPYRPRLDKNAEGLRGMFGVGALKRRP